jgi:hypothetical protein
MHKLAKSKSRRKDDNLGKLAGLGGRRLGDFGSPQAAQFGIRHLASRG